ncbi:MAG: hypothetical protein COB02_06710 [Candidatus Cloacimonadota bacterium]|nr:MAG: hypothetical protein COB02_06710 [Candidatus Cloacimonadota bacterium]
MCLAKKKKASLKEVEQKEEVNHQDGDLPHVDDLVSEIIDSWAQPEEKEDSKKVEKLKIY